VPTPEGAPPARLRTPARGPARGPARLLQAVHALEPEQRIAGLAALALWISMFLPWYSKTVLELVKSSLQQGGYDLSAFGAFSFVEAAVLLVASATLALLFARGERRAFHLPGGDGLVILAGGIWVSLLIFYRMLDKPVLTGTDKVAATVGLQWGIFFALAASISLAYAGARVRAAHRPEPALRDDPTVARDVAGRPAGRRPPNPPRRARTPQPQTTGPRDGPRAPQRPPASPAPAPGRPPAAPPARPQARPTAPPFDADADARGPAGSGFDPPDTPSADEDLHDGVHDDPTVDRRDVPGGPAAEDPPTRVIRRRLPRFDDLDAEWISADELSLEADPPATDGER